MTRETDLTKAIARTRAVIIYARERAMEHNHPEWHGDVLVLLDLADEYLAVHTPEYQIDMVADHYDLIAAKAREILFADDEEMAPDSPVAALFGAIGQLIGAADGVRHAAATLGKLPTCAAQPLPDKIEIDRSTYRRQLDALLSHVREASDMIKQKVEPEATAPDQGLLEQKIIGNYVNEMNLTNKSIHVTISIGDGIDLAVLERFVSRLATATHEMIESVKVWPGGVATRLRIGIEAVRKPVRRAVGSIDRLTLKLVQAEAKVLPPPLPDDYLKQAKAMILAGQAPPAHWVPHIENLNFVGTRLSDLTPLAAMTALRYLNLRNTQVRDVTPLAELTALQSLNLAKTQVSNIMPLAKLTVLKNLNLGETQVSDITPLAAMTALKSLHLISTQVSDIMPLAKLTALQNLFLSDTQVSDITPLAAMTALQNLDLINIQVSDITVLLGIPYLRLDPETKQRVATLRATLAPLSDVKAIA